MKRFTEVSLGHRHAGLNRARSDRKPTRRNMLFAIVADKLDLYSGERRLGKEERSFKCVLFTQAVRPGFSFRLSFFFFSAFSHKSLSGL